MSKKAKLPQVKIEMACWDGKYKITKIVHDSQIPLLPPHKPLRVGDVIRHDEELVDALALKYDVTVSQSKQIIY